MLYLRELPINTSRATSCTTTRTHGPRQQTRVTNVPVPVRHVSGWGQATICETRVSPTSTWEESHGSLRHPRPDNRKITGTHWKERQGDLGAAAGTGRDSAQSNSGREQGACGGADPQSSVAPRSSQQGPARRPGTGPTQEGGAAGRDPKARGKDKVQRRSRWKCTKRRDSKSASRCVS